MNRFDEVVGRVLSETMYKSKWHLGTHAIKMTKQEINLLKTLAKRHGKDFLASISFHITLKEWDDSDDGDRPMQKDLVVSKVGDRGGYRYVAHVMTADLDSGREDVDDSLTLETDEFDTPESLPRLSELVTHRIGGNRSRCGTWA